MKPRSFAPLHRCGNSPKPPRPAPRRRGGAKPASQTRCLPRRPPHLQRLRCRPRHGRLTPRDLPPSLLMTLRSGKMETDEIMAEAPNLDHLLPTVRQTALLPASERMQRVRAERWIGYPKAHDALAKLEQIFTNPKR